MKIGGLGGEGGSRQGGKGKEIRKQEVGVVGKGNKGIEEMKGRKDLRKNKKKGDRGTEREKGRSKKTWQ